MEYKFDFIGFKLVLWGLEFDFMESELVLWGLECILWGFVAYSGQGCDVDNLKIIEDIVTQSCTPTPLHYREKTFLSV